MNIKILIIFSLLSIVFLSGCIEKNEEVGYSDEALKLETEISEKTEGIRILPGQTVRMIVYLTNQVENPVKDVDFYISNPYGIMISRVDCGFGCVCERGSNSCGNVSCDYNGCHFDEIQSLDQYEIDFSLKIPSEEEISYFGWELKPELTLEYNYSGVSILYLPILKYGEKMEKPASELTQTKGPIHVDIQSDKWISSGSIFPLYVSVKDVINSQSRIKIEKNNFHLSIPDYIELNETEIGRCDFSKGDGYYIPKKGDIMLPLKNPLVCTLKANVTIPMVKAPIQAEYSYRYRVVKTEDIKVEHAIA